MSAGSRLGNYANSSFTVRTLVHSTNIASLFAENGVPKDVDYVSIDIDSADIWVLQALLTAGWRPLVISVEYNPNFPATTSPIVYPDPKRHGFAGDYTYTGWNHTCFLGSSARALEEMMVAHDYALTNVSLGFDLFFVRGDAWRPRPILTSVPRRANHVPTQRCFSPRGMYPQEAANYLSWSALQGGETVCRARLQAHRVLRELATAEGTCKSASRGCKPCRSGWGRRRARDLWIKTRHIEVTRTTPSHVEVLRCWHVAQCRRHQHAGQGAACARARGARTVPPFCAAWKLCWRPLDHLR